jgi:drug/metabolite transporter (DMT)-like permease
MIQKPKKNSFKTPHLGLMMIRGVVLFFATLCTYYGYRNLPLTLATSIGFTGPLLTAFLGVIFLKETISTVQILGFITCYVGIVLATQPGIHGKDIMWPVIVELVGNILASCSILLAKHLSKSHNSLQTLTLSTLICSGCFFVCLPFFYTPVSGYDLIILLCIAGCATLSSYAYIHALRFERASFVSLFEYLRYPLSFILGYCLFSERLNRQQIIGTILIMASVYICVHRKTSIGYH